MMEKLVQGNKSDNKNGIIDVAQEQEELMKRTECFNGERKFMTGKLKEEKKKFYRAQAHLLFGYFTGL